MISFYPTKNFSSRLIKKVCSLLVIGLFVLSPKVYTQSFFDTFQDSTSPSTTSSEFSSDLTSERIHRISESRRIFIITNNNQSFNEGDYISLILNDELAVRALAARTTDENLAGIKILQIYSLTLWNRLREGREVQVIRGDDSVFNRARNQQQQEEEEPDTLISDDRDLFDSTTFLEDEVLFDDETEREINQDNVVSVYLGLVEGIDNDGSTRRYNQLNGAWAYQFQNNIWAEASYGRTVINDFPNPELDTTFTNITLKVKYTVSAPFHSYILPYVGYQILDAEAPGAGEPGDGTEDIDLDAELRRLEDIKKSDLIFGVTALKRLVPGWFLRADLGSDAISVGFALEF